MSFKNGINQRKYLKNQRNDSAKLTATAEVRFTTVDKLTSNLESEMIQRKLQNKENERI